MFIGLYVYIYIFDLYNFIFQRIMWKMISAYFLWLDYWTLKKWKTAKLQIILSQHSNYLHKFLVHFLTCLLVLSFFFREIRKCMQA